MVDEFVTFGGERHDGAAILRAELDARTPPRTRTPTPTLSRRTRPSPEPPEPEPPEVDPPRLSRRG